MMPSYTSDCSFANSSPIFTIFEILVNNDMVDRSHDFGYHGNHFDRKICVTLVTKMGKRLNTGCTTLHDTSLESRSLQHANFDIMYIKIIISNSTAII